MLSVGNDVIQPVTVVRDLGVHIEAELLIKQHISRVFSSRFCQLRQLCQIRHRASGYDTLVQPTQLLQRCTGNPSWVNHRTLALAGLSELTIGPLQRVQNATHCLINNTKQRDPINPVLMCLHWLPIKLRNIYKLCTQMHLIRTNQRPDHVAQMV